MLPRKRVDRELLLYDLERRRAGCSLSTKRCTIYTSAERARKCAVAMHDWRKSFWTAIAPAPKRSSRN
jgi:hypothetical protein